LNKIQNLFKLSTKCVSSASAEHGTKFEADKPDKAAARDTELECNNVTLSTLIPFKPV